ncbi:hypothetical protein EN829_045675 [Mesorhizobium sp. M00.F.Ca.ET.186.01.1.1]|nr:hypothetical protein EN829_045675 [Mesorhizobium sp. M00.F.Ca.ET.186.01.1.1]
MDQKQRGGFRMKKWIGSMVVGILSAALLVGCGQSGGSTGAKSGSAELTVYTALEDDQLKAYVEA